MVAEPTAAPGRVAAVHPGPRARLGAVAPRPRVAWAATRPAWRARDQGAPAPPAAAGVRRRAAPAEGRLRAAPAEARLRAKAAAPAPLPPEAGAVAEVLGAVRAPAARRSRSGSRCG